MSYPGTTFAVAGTRCASQRRERTAERRTEVLADALGVSRSELSALLRQLRRERRDVDVCGARPRRKTAEDRDRDRAAYIVALSAKLHTDPSTVRAALARTGI